MMILVLPILIPLAGASLGLIFWRSLRMQRLCGVASTTALLVASVFLLLEVNSKGVIATNVGGWPAPFGIVLVADRFAAMMVVLAALVGLATTVFSLATTERRREIFGYYPLICFLLMGVCGAFLTGDIFNLYVWFEVMLIASFVLLALGGERNQMEAAMKYVTLNLMASALFLAAVGLVYGLTGTLNMAELASRLNDVSHDGIVTVAAIVFLVAFGIKAAMFPLFFWLPASYHTPPVAISALFAGLLTKVGVYALVRVFTLLFVQDVGYTHDILLFAAGATMVTGVLGAFAQEEVRRILSFHIVSQIGYMIMGLALFTPLALAGTVFYLAHHIIVKTNLFLVGGVIQRIRGTGRLVRLGGLYTSSAWLSILFLIPAMSLAGMPPLSGFFGKLTLIRAGLDVNEWPIVVAALVTGLLTLMSMTKIWAEAFWKPEPDPPSRMSPISGRDRLMVFGPIVVFAALTIGIGLAAGPLLDFSIAAAEQLLDRQSYIEVVLK